MCAAPPKEYVPLQEHTAMDACAMISLEVEMLKILYFQRTKVSIFQNKLTVRHLLHCLNWFRYHNVFVVLFIGMGAFRWEKEFKIRLFPVLFLTLFWLKICLSNNITHACSLNPNPRRKPILEFQIFRRCEGIDF